MRATEATLASAITAVVLLLSGCGGKGSMGGYDAGAGGMAAQAQAVDAHVTGVESDLKVHAAIVTGTSDPAAVAAEEDAHEALVAQHADSMEALVDSMRQCPHLDSGTASAMNGMDASISLMRDECDDHRLLMAGATNADEIKAEEERHAEAMDVILDEMHSSSGEMMDMMESHPCEMGMGSMNMMGHGM